MKKPNNPKERNLIKGALRRLFSRSDIRRSVVQESVVQGYYDPQRPRVTKWSFCPDCQTNIPTYLMEVDHISPLIGINETLDDLTWDEVIDRLWCAKDNLRIICKTCHKVKSKLENSERRKAKREKNKK